MQLDGNIGLIFGVLLSLLVATTLIGSLGAFVYDPSGDGLSLGEEIVFHDTDPFTADTDGDGLTDHDEIHEYGTDPTATDTTGDGLTDYEEVQEYETAPTATDTDRDGLSDYDEIHKYGTDPTKPDTTGDGLTDYEEVHEYGTDPTTTDTDTDGVADYEEVHNHETDPMVTDTDSDGLTDYEEIHKYGTDPTAVDTTGDGLTDYKEIHEYGTDPTTTDTNNDGLPDYAEIHRYGTDPTVDDTDEDGISDAASVVGAELDPQLFGNLHPTRKDILVQIDVMEGVSIPDAEIARLKQAFAEAPVDNPDGTTGINVHVIVNEDASPYEEHTDVRDYFANQYTESFDLNQYGYRHVLIVNDARAEGESVRGVTLRRSNGMIVQADAQAHETGPIVMHELGHSLGLYQSTHEGIDSRDVPIEEYPSIMNYNNFRDCFGDQCSILDTPYLYSTGDNGPRDHADWAVIEDRMMNSINTDVLDQRATEHLKEHGLP